MDLDIAGQDRSSDLGAELTRRATRHQGPLSPWAADDSALSLNAAKGQEEFMAQYCRLLRQRCSISTESFPIPGKPGFAGSLLRRIKGILWKRLRYQHDRMACQQNTVNELVVNAVDFQRETTQRTITALEQRLAALEAELAELRKRGTP